MNDKNFKPLGAILTKNIKGTKKHPFRVKATSPDGKHSTILGWGTRRSIHAWYHEAHYLVAKQLMEEMQWEGELLGSFTHDGYAFLIMP